MDDYDSLILESSLRAAANRGGLQLPWEQGIMGEICGADCGWLSKLPCDVEVQPPPPAPVAQGQTVNLKRKRTELPVGVPLYVHSILAVDSVDEKSYSDLRELDWTKGLAMVGNSSRLKLAVCCGRAPV